MLIDIRKTKGSFCFYFGFSNYIKFGVELQSTKKMYDLRGEAVDRTISSVWTAPPA